MPSSTATAATTEVCGESRAPKDDHRKCSPASKANLRCSPVAARCGCRACPACFAPPSSAPQIVSALRPSVVPRLSPAAFEPKLRRATQSRVRESTPKLRRVVGPQNRDSIQAAPSPSRLNLDQPQSYTGRRSRVPRHGRPGEKPVNTIQFNSNALTAKAAPAYNRRGFASPRVARVPEVQQWRLMYGCDGQEAVLSPILRLLSSPFRDPSGLFILRPPSPHWRSR